MNVVDVRVGTGVGAPPRRHVVDTPDLAVPDEVADAEPASHRTRAPLVIGCSQPAGDGVAQGQSVRRLAVEHPVQRAPLSVVAVARPADPVDVVAVVLVEQLTESGDPGQRSVEAVRGSHVGRRDVELGGERLGRRVGNGRGHRLHRRATAAGEHGAPGGERNDADGQDSAGQRVGPRGGQGRAQAQRHSRLRSSNGVRNRCVTEDPDATTSPVLP